MIEFSRNICRNFSLVNETLMIVMGVALLTVSWQSWRAATRNPVEALRYE